MLADEPGDRRARPPGADRDCVIRPSGDGRQDHIAGLAVRVVEQDPYRFARLPDPVVDGWIGNRSNDKERSREERRNWRPVTAPSSSSWRLTSSPSKAGTNDRLTTVTSALPEKYAAFRAATSPPPKITMRLPEQSTKRGIIC